jgi:hypothetical protein
MKSVAKATSLPLHYGVRDRAEALVTALCRRALAEAVAAVDRAVASWLERHFGILAALSADGREELPRRAIPSSVAALRLARLTA